MLPPILEKIAFTRPFALRGVSLFSAGCGRSPYSYRIVKLQVVGTSRIPRTIQFLNAMERDLKLSEHRYCDCTAHIISCLPRIIYEIADVLPNAAAKVLSGNKREWAMSIPHAIERHCDKKFGKNQIKMLVLAYGRDATKEFLERKTPPLSRDLLEYIMQRVGFSRRMSACIVQKSVEQNNPEILEWALKTFKFESCINYDSQLYAAFEHSCTKDDLIYLDLILEHLDITIANSKFTVYEGIADSLCHCDIPDRFQYLMERFDADENDKHLGSYILSSISQTIEDHSFWRTVGTDRARRVVETFGLDANDVLGVLL